ncbi:hypothetical protein CEXT_266691 [Caerostris extrusa]|uniref:Uncharacterized protein n=1 Tax=Caerostris extrusa TaxID=172846 RepID=A0AAV4WHY9_CAEEX|nr:hypothetical protein CEXT_266691 [Caerostris extrusa]
MIKPKLCENGQPFQLNPYETAEKVSWHEARRRRHRHNVSVFPRNDMKRFHLPAALDAWIETPKVNFNVPDISWRTSDH